MRADSRKASSSTGETTSRRSKDNPAAITAALTRVLPPVQAPLMAAQTGFLRPRCSLRSRGRRSAYLANEELASKEGRVERFFINLVLMRVLYAHALVAAPRLALGWLAPCGRAIGDPRVGMTGIFLSLSRVLPDSYPLEGDLDTYVDAEHSLGHLLDVGIIVPRLDQLYDWSATELGLPALNVTGRGRGTYSGVRVGPAGRGRLASRAVPSCPTCTARGTGVAIVLANPLTRISRDRSRARSWWTGPSVDPRGERSC